MSDGYRGKIEESACRLNVGNFVIHFKHENDTLENAYKYVYKIIGIGIDVDTLERKMIYQEVFKESQKIWLRDEQEFLSEVDRVKYPTIHQQYRLERLSYEEVQEISARRETLK